MLHSLLGFGSYANKRLPGYTVRLVERKKNLIYFMGEKLILGVEGGFGMGSREAFMGM